MRRRRLLQSESGGIPDNVVDLGLPSGTLWATGNLCKNGSNYYIGSETDWGTYVSWGNIIGHNEGEGYNFDQTTYDSSPGKQVSANIPSTDAAHDIALATLGTPWHLPTKEDFQELYDNTDSEWVADYNGTGVAGRKFMKKTNHSIYVFFPASGYYRGTSLYIRGTGGDYWSASFSSATGAYGLSFGSSVVGPQNVGYRRLGRSVRPVMKKPYVDLGLPSGLLWAKGNLIKDSNGNYAIGAETDWGTYVSWGNIIGHNEGEGYNFDQTTYNSTPGKQVAANIPSNDAAHDIALATLGTPWHLPAKEDFQELYDNTDFEWVANYKNTGVAGCKFMKKTNHSIYVFFPASGGYIGTSLGSRGAGGDYWSASFDSATYAYSLYFNSSRVYPQGSNNRRLGCSVRPVYPPLPLEPITSKTLSYTINQTDPTASPTSIIIKNTPSNQASSSTDVIAWIHENTDIVVADTTLSNGKLRCAKTSRTDKTKYLDGTSIPSFTSKDVFVKLPEFWWKVEEDSTDVYKIGFSKEARPGWNRWEGNTFIGAYKAYNNSNKVYSRSGVTPTVSVTQANFKTYARARGTGYTLISYESHCMIALLGYGWLGTTDSQSVVGYGSTDYPKTTGKCNSLGMTDTTTSNGGSSTSNNTSTSINFWGIENWWGDINEWVDNLETANTTRLINILDSSENVVRTVQSPITSSGCIGKMMLGEYGDMIPKETHSNTSYNNGFCDYGNVYTSSGYVAHRSSYGARANCGLGYLYLNNSSGKSNSNVGSRLQYKGDYTMVDKL